MRSLYKQLILLMFLVGVIMVWPAVILADQNNLSIDPVSATLSAGDWVYKKISQPKPKPFFDTERTAKFERWGKEDWIKDDPYACMWDRDWMRKYKVDVCK